MTSRDFCYWLQGCFEVSGAKELTAEQVETVKRHLSMVFVHEIDPSMGNAKHQANLQAIHDGADPKASAPKTEVHHHHHGGFGPALRC